MEANHMQTPIQPFIKLMQANMELMGRYPTSPEAVLQLTQGMFRNYTEFVGEMAQTGLALFSQGQAALMQGAENAAEAGAEATGRTRRGR